MKVLLLGEGELLAARVRAALPDDDVTVLPASREGAPLTLEAMLPRQGADAVLLAVHAAAELAAALRSADADGSPPGIVVLSPDPEDAEPAHDAGALFLPLPFTAAELRATLAVATRPRPLVLLCDDSTLIHRHTVPLLRDAGYEVHGARDGAEGLEQAAALRPDLVITDIEMPRLDGYGLCRALKARFPHLPVVICSALGEAQDVERGFDAGADDFLVKPAQPEELLSRVALLLRARRPLPPRERLLVVDDSPAVRQLIAESLRRQGFSVLTAADGEAGLRLARHARPALIISDYDMPRLTGFGMVHALRQDAATRDVPVMMLTARGSRRDQAQMRAVGVTAYLVKPFVVDKCVAMVERLLAERRLRAYKDASRLYISDAAAAAAEHVAESGDRSVARATEAAVAVLFSDIRGFTPLSEQRTPREVVELLNGYFDAMCPIIREEGGDIDKFIGDAIMAVFADRPGDADPAPLRAVRAGLRMQEALLRWNQQTGRDIGMRIGVNTGPVVRGDIGSRHVRRDYTVIGDVVNRAQRFEQNAPVGGVLIGPATYEAVRGRVRCAERPALRLKGVSEPVSAYLALSLLPEEEPAT